MLCRIDDERGEVVGVGAIHLHTRERAYKDVSVVVGANGTHEVVLQGVGVGGVVAICDELRAIEATEAVFGSYPDGLISALLDLVDQAVGQVIVGSKEQI